MTYVEQEIEQIEGKDVNMENIMKEKISNESKISTTIQGKQKFRTFDDVLITDHSFEKTDFKKKAKMEWETYRDEQIHKRRAENVYKNISLVLDLLQ